MLFNIIEKRKDSKNIIFLGREALIFGGGTSGKFWENGQKQGNLLLYELGSGQF